MNVVRLPPIRDKTNSPKKFDFAVGKSSWSIEYRQRFRFLPPLRKTQLPTAIITNEPLVQYNRAHEAADAHWKLKQKDVGRRNNRKILKHLRNSLNKHMQQRIQDLDEQSGSAGSVYRPRSGGDWSDIVED